MPPARAPGSWDLAGFHQELSALSERISELRGRRDGRPEDLLGALDLALVELEVAEEELRTCLEELHLHGEQIALRVEGADREWQMLNTTFRELPVPVFLLSPEGTIHRANDEAARLLSSTGERLTGKPLAAQVHVGYRRIFRSALGAALRGARPGPLPLLLTRADGTSAVHVQLARLETPPGARPLISAVVLSPDDTPGSTGSTGSVGSLHTAPRAIAAAGRAGARDKDGDAAAQRDEIAMGVRRLDVVCRMTRLLVGEPLRPGPGLLEQAVGLLATEFAARVIVFLVRAGTPHQVAAMPADAPPYARPRAGTGPGTKTGSRARREGSTATAQRVARAVIGSGAALLEPAPPAEAVGPRALGPVLGVPLGSGPETLGALVLLRSDGARGFTLPDLGLLEELGQHLAMALLAERDHRRRANAAQVLQASLLPAELPEIPYTQVAGLYRPPGEGPQVGGDFYDAFATLGGWGLVLGDVCGKGVEAASVTAAVRHGIRTLSVWEHHPEVVLEKVNQAMAVQHPTDRFVTAVVAHVRAEKDVARVRLASAGHLPAAVLRADGTVGLARGGGRPLGLCDSPEAEAEDLVLEGGDVLLMYSDGVTEARDHDRSFFDDARLLAALAGARGMSAEAVVRAVEQQVLEFTGGAPQDDLTLLALRVVPLEEARS
ncbi:SpoIIE family protein phosphatase [Streptomyces sp. H10-C2]|uniref:SpoIIE family protein phosphatase n=1 Tax=unclassified Streptomyces TaxID=2593676 RepID=UPI0024BAF87F|nr:MULTISPECIES: SpoIIE family protein phosphatase [unclassified Streptomyces]MDJ0342701.1 SpoIIE family protein phosphatase [Streptomyces sp. PH10-H1]MDJ0372590.1 SpoIIE family protein phosphatase [Streptomyces sp. H10-C2]